VERSQRNEPLLVRLQIDDRGAEVAAMFVAGGEPHTRVSAASLDDEHVVAEITILPHTLERRELAIPYRKIGGDGRIEQALRVRGRCTCTLVVDPCGCEHGARRANAHGAERVADSEQRFRHIVEALRLAGRERKTHPRGREIALTRAQKLDHDIGTLSARRVRDPERRIELAPSDAFHASGGRKNEICSGKSSACGESGRNQQRDR
jgi:hypothetical protein